MKTKLQQEKLEGNAECGGTPMGPESGMEKRMGAALVKIFGIWVGLGRHNLAGRIAAMASASMFFFLLFTCTTPNSAAAAVKTVEKRLRTRVIKDGEPRRSMRPYNYNFTMCVISDMDGTKQEGARNGRPFITARPEERYSVVLHNPLPVQVAVNLTMDGVNSIDGKPCKPSEGTKWLMEPYGSITISGWQISDNDARRFYFTTKKESYAKWRSNSWGSDLSVNCGVIGAAFFWNKAELARYYEDNPVYEWTPRRPVTGCKPVQKSGKDGWLNEWLGFSGDKKCKSGGEAAAGPAASERDLYAESAVGCPAPKPAEPMPARQKQRAGTGMGEHQSNPVTRVNFNYDTGMYNPKDALVIYYDFAPDEQRPQPFLSSDYTPEQPL